MNKDFSCAYLENALMLTPIGEMRPCCRFDPHASGSPRIWNSEENLRTAWENSGFTQLNQQAAKGESPHGCHKCQREEEMNLKSMRLKPFPLQEQKAKLSSGLQFLELSAGRNCNLKCRSCSAIYSTKWDSDARKLGEFVPTSEDNLPLNRIPLSLLSELKSMKISGGEPMLNPFLLPFLDQLKQEKLSQNISLQMYTNGTKPPSQKIVEAFNSFASTHILISIDAIEEQNTYLRHPAPWGEMVRGVDEWLDYFQKNPSSSLSFAVTVSAYNILSLFDLFHWLLNKTPEALENVVLQIAHDPLWMSVAEWPDPAKVLLKGIYLEQKRQFESQHQIPKTLRSRLQMVEVLFESSRDSDIHLKQFLQKTRQLDQLRGESFEQVFPRIQSVISAL